MTFDALTLDGLQRILADVHERENEAWRKINAELRKVLGADPPSPKLRRTEANIGGDWI